MAHAVTQLVSMIGSCGGMAFAHFIHGIVSASSLAHHEMHASKYEEMNGILISIS